MRAFQLFLSIVVAIAVIYSFAAYLAGEGLGNLLEGIGELERRQQPYLQAVERARPGTVREGNLTLPEVWRGETASPAP